MNAIDFQEYVPHSAVSKKKKDVLMSALITLAMMQQECFESQLYGRRNERLEQYADFLARDLGMADRVNLPPLCNYPKAPKQLEAA
jgi:hypothetical protein